MNSFLESRYLKLSTFFLLGSFAAFLLATNTLFSQSITNESFDQWRKNDPTIISKLLNEMPKGGELHSHLSGAIHFDDLYKIALKYDYQVYIDKDTIGFVLPLDRSIKEERRTKFQQRCKENAENCFEAKNLNDEQRDKLKSALIIDKNDLQSTERHSYKSFNTVFDALDDLTDNADLIPELIQLAMIDASTHNLSYIELKMSPYGRSNFKRENVKIETLLENISSAIEEQNKAFEQSNRKKVITKIIAQINRTDPLRPGGATDFEPIKCTQDCYLKKNKNYLHSRLRQAYYLASLSPYNDLLVGIDFVGLPENEISTKPNLNYLLGSLRAEFGNVNITMHAGESNRPGWYDHVAEAVNMGALRIGHGVNLVQDMETWDLICRRGTPIEINLTSNVLLGVVNKLENHPFPLLFNKSSCAISKTEKGKPTNDPVTLNTDNAGIFQTNMSNEFCLAALYFDLSWEDIKQLARNSLKYSFATPTTRRNLVENWDKEISIFEQTWQPMTDNTNCKYPSLN